jgi:hypothetical protein
MRMAKLSGRQADLRRLAAKQGWRDGCEGSEPKLPTKCVWHPNGVRERPVSAAEQSAYWVGYEKGRGADNAAPNPYGSGSVDSEDE